MKTKVLMALAVIFSIFTTSCQKDKEENEPQKPFKIESITPADKSVDVSVTTNFKAVFSEEILESTVCGKRIFLTSSEGTIECDAEFDGIKTVVFTPTKRLLFDKKYTLMIKDVMSEKKVVMDVFEISFTTEKSTFRIVESMPANNSYDARLSFGFVLIRLSKDIKTDQPIDQISIYINGIRARYGNNEVTAKWIFGCQKDLVMVMPNGPANFPLNTKYTIDVEGIVAVDGTVLQKSTIVFTSGNVLK